MAEAVVVGANKHSPQERAPQKCTARTEVYARVCGFFRPVQGWNKGKREEYRERKVFVIEKKAPDAEGDGVGG